VRPIYFRLMAAIFNLQHAQTQDNIPSSLFMLLDPGNMGVALEFRCYVYTSWDILYVLSTSG